MKFWDNLKSNKIVLMISKGDIRTILLILLSFAIFQILFLNFKSIKIGLDEITQNGLISHILAYIIIGFPIFIGTWLIDRKTNIFKSLGVSSSIITALWTSLLFTFSMYIGGLLFFKFNQEINYNNLIAGTIVAGFMEELYFRGFLFGQLFRKSNLGFLSSVIIGALIFALGHLHQSQNIMELVGIFMITFSGAIFFAWLFVEWNYNLWVPILTHSLMNLSWSLFEVDSTALGDLKANIFRGLTIFIAIVFTILYKRYKQQKLIINMQTLILKKESAI
jgi:membrane protease YdiL (CAAX protease family)